MMRVLVLDDDGILSVLPVIRCLGLSRTEIYLTSIKENRSLNPSKYSKFVKEYIPLNLTSDIIEQLRSITKSRAIDLIMPVKEKTFMMFAGLSDIEKMGLPLPPLSDHQVFDTVTNKWLLHKWLIDHSFPSPATIEANQLEAGMLEYPWVLKPKHGAGGKNIQIIADCDGLNGSNLSGSEYDDFIVQECLNGEDRDISVFSIDGEIIAYTIQKGFISRNFSYAHAIEFLKDDALLNITEKILSELKWSGVAHLDFRYEKKSGKYYLIDFNPRFWSTILGSLAMGVNFPEIVAETSMKKPNTFNGYRNEQFLLSGIAVRKLLSSLVLPGKTIPVRNTSLFYIFKDPLPDLMNMFKWFSNAIRRQ